MECLLKTGLHLPDLKGVHVHLPQGEEFESDDYTLSDEDLARLLESGAVEDKNAPLPVRLRGLDNAVKAAYKAGVAEESIVAAIQALVDPKPEAQRMVDLKPETQTMDEPQTATCIATTKSGQPCKGRPVPGSAYCGPHKAQGEE